MKDGEGSVTVQPMPPSRSTRSVRRVQRQERRRARRMQRFALLTLVGLVAVITLLLTAFGSPNPVRTASTAPAPAQRLLPTGPPQPLVVALQGSLRIQLPVARTQVTAIGYHGAGDSALPLEPLGRQGNEGLFARLVHRIFGGGSSGIVWYQLDRGGGPSTGALDVGAAPGTEVYSPVDGKIVGLTDYVVNNEVFGRRIDIEPAAAPSIVISITHVQPDPSLAVGSSLAAGRVKLGTLLDLSGVERQGLARYTNDRGNHVTVEVHPAATLALP